MTSTKQREQAQTAESTTTKSGRRAYSAPRLERLGNVRDVLGKTGPTGDATKQNPKRP